MFFILKANFIKELFNGMDGWRRSSSKTKEFFFIELEERGEFNEFKALKW